MAGNIIQTAGLFSLTLVSQVIGLSLLPKTDGFTNLKWTAPSLFAIITGLWAVAMMSRQGVNLSLLIPLIAASVPLCVIIIAVFIQGEQVSAAKFSILVLACALIGFAGFIE